MIAEGQQGEDIGASDSGATKSDSVTDQIKQILESATGDGDAPGDADDGAGNQAPADSGERGADGEALLDGDGEANVPGDNEGDQAPDGEGDNDAPVSLKELAEHMGVDTADMYDVEISIGSGETATLGELKDAYKEYGPIGEAREAITQRESDLEKQVIATRAELSHLINMIPPDMRGQLIQQARERNKQWSSDQRQVVIEAIPAWADEENQRKDRAAIVSMGAEYGFSEPEMLHTEDARTLKVLHDFVKLRERFANMDSDRKRVRGKPNGKGRTQSKEVKARKLAQAIRAAKASPRMGDKRAVISHLIKNQG